MSTLTAGTCCRPPIWLVWSLCGTCLVRYSLCSSLLFMLSLWMTAESGTWGTLPFLAYATVTTLTLVPSPLLEFRYFIVPFIMLRLHVKPKTDSQLQFESIIYTIINAVTIAMFLFRPFKWPSESGWQRFMW